MGSFGERMQREREMRGITLEEIAESTKIGTRSLRALEGEDFDKLPGGIFNKGFVRAYARYLGIDEEQAVADFVAAYGEHQLQLPQPPEGEVKQDDEHTRSLNLLAVGGAIVVLVLLFVIWGFRDRISEVGSRVSHRLRHAPTAPAPTTVAAAPDPTPAPASVNPPAAPETTAAAPAATTTTSSSSSSSKPPEAASKAAVTPAVSKDAGSKPAASASTQLAKASEVAATGKEFVLVVRARQDAWVKIKADDELLMEGTLKGAVEKTVHAKQKIVLTTGNAGAIELSFNGETQPALGDDNQVKTVVFTPDGRLR